MLVVFLMFSGGSLVLARLLMRSQKLPISISMMALALSVALLCEIFLPLNLHHYILKNLSLNIILLDVILPFLLFAGALCLNKNTIKQHMPIISALAIGSTILSIILITCALYYTIPFALGMPWSLTLCALVGAIVSPTDPVAVLGLLKFHKLPEKIHTIIACESLFNDGIGIVAYTVFLHTLHSPHITWTAIMQLGSIEVFGGLLGGYLLHIFSQCILCITGKNTTLDQQLILDIGLLLVGYHTLQYLGSSGALAIVVFGICTAHTLKYNASDNLRSHYFEWWESLDNILNCILYALMGAQIIYCDIQTISIGYTLCFVVALIGIRGVSVIVPLVCIRQWHAHKTLSPIIIWGGLRGGLALALVQALPDTLHQKPTIMTLCFAVVCFSVIIQGLTVSPLIKKYREKL